MTNSAYTDQLAASPPQGMTQEQIQHKVEGLALGK